MNSLRFNKFSRFKQVVNQLKTILNVVITKLLVGLKLFIAYTPYQEGE